MNERKTEILSKLKALENDENDRNWWGFVLGGESGKIEIDLSIFDKNEAFIEIFKFNADNAFTAVLYQYEILNIFKNSTLTDCVVRVDKLPKNITKDSLIEQKGNSYQVILKGNMSQIAQNYQKIIESVDAENIVKLKQKIANKKEQNEKKKASDDTLQYFLQKSENRIIKNFERVM